MARTTVAIITLNRAEMLRHCLECLCRQTRPADEVVIVDNGSEDGTRAVVYEYAARLPIRYVVEPKRGYSSARNAALRAARGDIVLFTDDDCDAAPDWCRALCAPIEAGGADLVGGAKLPGEPANYTMWADYLCTESAVLHPALPRGPRPALSTSNLALARRVIEKTGEFDERFLMCEDRDFCMRATGMGFRLLFEPTALVYHRGLARSVSAYLDKMRRYGRGSIYYNLTHGQAEPLARIFPRRVAPAAALFPEYAAMTAAYLLWHNVRLEFARTLQNWPLILLGACWRQYGMIQGIRYYRKLEQACR